MLKKVNRRRYKNAFEKSVGDVVEAKGFKYESTAVSYVVPSSYTPDFSGHGIHVEVKGYFRPGDRQKYKAINKALRAAGEQLVFILYDPDKQCRKDNKITMGQWCDKSKIQWFRSGLEFLEWWNANSRRNH